MIEAGVQIVGDIFIKKSGKIPFTLPDIQGIRLRNSSRMPHLTNLFVFLSHLVHHTGMTILLTNIIGKINPLIFIKM